MKRTIGFIGGGRITGIFLQAFKNKGFSPSGIAVFDTSNEISRALQQKFPQIEITTQDRAASRDIVFIALHPPVILDSLEQVKMFFRPDACVISLAPKITIEKISSKLNGSKNVARLIPNATSVINKGYNPVTFAKDFSGKKEIMEILEILGHTFETEENKLEAYAIISAMMPTYFWFQWQELRKVGMQTGLNEAESTEALEKTLAAAIETLYHSGLSYDEVIDLIPVKPISAYERQIREIYSGTLVSLFEKIKP